MTFSASGVGGSRVCQCPVTFGASGGRVLGELVSDIKGIKC